MSTTVTYKGETLTTVSNATKTLTTQGKYLEDNITLTDVSSSAPTLQSKSVSYTPSETAQSQTVTPDSGYDGLDEVSVSVGAISSTYVGSGITRRSSSDLTASGATVTAPAGYYAGDASATIPNATLTGQSSIIKTGATIANSANEIILVLDDATHYAASTGGYISSGNKELTSDIQLRADCAINPTLLTSGPAVTAPKGYYTRNTSTSVASGTEGTPTATKGTVSNHSVSVTPSVTNTTGYITGSTKTGTAVTVSASELVSGTKSISANGTGIDVTNYASVDVAVPSEEPNLQAKTNIAPSTSSQTITADTGYDGLSSVQINAMPSGSTGTPTATKGAVSNHSVSVTPSVTNTTGYITGGTKTGTAVSVSASELVSGTVNITSSGNTDVTNYATASVAAGSVTASTTRSLVTNHSVTITPSVTRTAGYITAGHADGTAITVSASELVSGSETKTQNGTYDVTNLAEIVVDVQGGGGGGVQIGKTTKTLASSASSIQFTGLSGDPTSFVVTSAEDIATNTSGVTAVAFDGTSLHGQTLTTQVTADTGFTKSYSNGTLTITATTALFQAVEYKLVYTYGGSASDIETADVQVGSGATSITFPVTGRPAYWSCIFKSDFGTSSGYQRVIEVVNDGSSTYGLAVDSSAHAASSWTATYSGGNLTINSQGTNNGGYFHQPGYYQLTYYVDASAPQYESVSKTYRASTSAQSETITPSSGYDAIEEVSISIPAVSQTNLTAANIKSGTTVSISNGSTNLWSVVGTYTGGGGGTLTVATKTLTHTSTGQTLTFSSLSGQPKYWFLRATSNVSSSGSTTYYYVTDLFYDGTNIKGNTFRIGSTRRVQNITSGITQSYSNGTLTITAGSSSGSTPGQFYGASNFGFELVYIY